MSRPPTDEYIRFWRRVDQTTTPEGCWEWRGAIHPGGYGVFGRAGGRTAPAHRAGYVFQVGPIPDGLCVCHHCDNRRCVRGSHLFVGTRDDNAQDAKNKGRMGVPGVTREVVSDLRVGGLLYREIAQRLGITRQRVGQILAERRTRPAAPTEAE